MPAHYFLGKNDTGKVDVYRTESCRLVVKQVLPAVRITGPDRISASVTVIEIFPDSAARLFAFIDLCARELEIPIFRDGLTTVINTIIEWKNTEVFQERSVLKQREEEVFRRLGIPLDDPPF